MRRGGRVFSYLAHRMSAVAATAAAHPRHAPASEARSVGPSRANTSAQGLTLVQSSAQRKHLFQDTLLATGARDTRLVSESLRRFRVYSEAPGSRPGPPTMTRAQDTLDGFSVLASKERLRLI